MLFLSCFFLKLLVKVSPTVVQRKKTGPPHKPMTYVEQLQKLSEGAPKTKVKGYGKYC